MSRRRPFYALALAEVLSISGSRLASIAIPWLVLTTTGSPVLTGIVAMAELIPSVVSRALGGPLIDRFGARRIAILCDLLAMLVLALIPLLAALGALQIGLLLPVVFLLGALRGPADGAKQALMPEIARLAGLPIERVTGTGGMIERLGSTVGAAAAGGLVALIGAPDALLVNAAAFLLSALVVGMGIPPLERAATAAPPLRLKSYFGELREGWRFLQGDAVLVGIVIMVGLTNLIDQAYGAVLAPVWAEGHGNAALLGLLFAVFAGASVGGAAIATALGERLPRLPVYVIAFILTGLPRFWIMAFAVPIETVFAVLALAGFASGFLNPILGAVVLERIPKPLLGRVSSLTTALGYVLMPFGGVLAGVLIGVTGLVATFLACGIAYFLVTLMPLARKSFRDFAVRPTIEAL